MNHSSDTFLLRLLSLSFLTLLFVAIGACTGSPQPYIQCKTDIDCRKTEFCKDSFCLKRPALEKPLIETAFPRKSDKEGRLLLVVRGRGFLEGAALLFNGSPIQTSKGKKEGELIGDLPRPSDGLHRVVVRQRDGVESFAYLLTVAKAPTFQRLSFSRVVTNCQEETLVVWGSNFWENVEVSLRLKTDASKEYKPTLVEQKSASELHVKFDFTQIPKGTYELVAHNGFVDDVAKTGFSIVDALPAPKLLNVSPRRFWLGTQSSAFVVGLNLNNALVFFDGKPVRLYGINRSTSSLQLDLRQVKKDGKAKLTVRNACAKESSEIEVELLGVPAPQLKATDPGTLLLVDVDDVTLSGDRFHPRAQLLIDGKPRPTAFRISTTRFQIPRSLFPRAETYKIQVVNPGGKKSKVLELKVSHTPVISNITPTYLSRTTPQKVTIEGSNFGSGVRIRINGKASDELEYINENRILLASSLFPDAKTYTIEVENTGDKSFVSKSYKLSIKYGPRILNVTPPLVLLPLSTGELQVTGNDLDDKSKVYLDGKVIDKATFSEGVLRVPVSLLQKEGNHTLQVENDRGEKSNVVTIPTSKVDKIAVQEIREVGELAYLCGVGVREETDNRPRALFKQKGKSLLEVELFVSTFDQKCLYFNTREIRFLASGLYQVQLCRNAIQGVDCSNDYPWQWRGISDSDPVSKAPPQLEWVRLLSPSSPVIPADKTPKTLSFVIGGKALRGNTVVRFGGKKLEPKGDFSIAVLSNQIIVYNMPVPDTLYGSHSIEVTTVNGTSNTTFLRFEEKPFLQLYWTPQLFIPRGGEYNFQLFGAGLERTLSLVMDGKAVTLGGKALAWSSFASTPPYFLSSFAWNEASKQAVGFKEVWLQNKAGLKSNKLIFPVGNSDQWGKEPLRLVAVDEPSRYLNKAGLAPASGETVSLRLAYTGFKLLGADGKTRGQVLMAGKPVTYTSSSTSLLGYSTVVMKATRFTGAPRLIPLQLKNPDGKLSNIQFVTVVPANSFRLTKIYNAADFSSILRPGRKTTLQIHGRGITKEMKIYFAGKKLNATLYYKNPDTKDEFVRVEIDPGDLPSGQYPLWAVKDNSSVSNSLLVTVARQGIGGAPRLRYINPMVWSKSALLSQGSKVRVAISAVGLTPFTTLILDGKEMKLTQLQNDTAYFTVDVSTLATGFVSLSLKNGELQSMEAKVTVTD